jgi:hypothetical protein
MSGGVGDDGETEEGVRKLGTRNQKSEIGNLKGPLSPSRERG